MAGLGQDDRRVGQREPGDVPEPGQAEARQQRGHVRPGLFQLAAGALQVAELVADPAEQAAPRPACGPGVVGQASTFRAIRRSGRGVPQPGAASRTRARDSSSTAAAS
jgi:hypothetical protein